MTTHSSSRLWSAKVNWLAASFWVRPGLRLRLYQASGLSIPWADIRPGCFFWGPNIRIGRGTMINRGCHFENRELIEIGEGCSLGMEVLIVTSSHEVGPHEHRAGEWRGSPVRIGAGCWIGARAVILPGVSIGDGAVVAAGAVVVKDCLPDGLYAGVPAARIKDLESG